jgi:hypothetical protein
VKNARTLPATAPAFKALAAGAVCWVGRSGLAGLLALLSVLPAQAHLMVAQQGTLNIVGDGAFMVLSLPASAFPDADDDRDGRLSREELQAHASDIQARVLAQVKLTDTRGSRPLQGLLLDLSPADDAPRAPASQLIVLGRFDLAGSQGPVTMTMGLFGSGAGERAHTVTVTRKPDVQHLDFDPGHTARAVLPPSWAAWADGPRARTAMALVIACLLPMLGVVAAWAWRRQRPMLRAWRLRGGALPR